MTIQRGDESEELDIENDVEVSTFGEAPFSESDAILPSADTQEEQEERDRLREATLGKTKKEDGEKKEEEEAQKGEQNKRQKNKVWKYLYI